MMTIILLLAIAGVISWGIVEIAKRAYMAYIESTPEDDKTPWWWNTVLRSAAVLIGGGIGVALMHSGLGFCLGLAGGALNTTMVAVVKQRLKAWAKSGDTGDEEK